MDAVYVHAMVRLARAVVVQAAAAAGWQAEGWEAAVASSAASWDDTILVGRACSRRRRQPRRVCVSVVSSGQNQRCSTMCVACRRESNTVYGDSGGIPWQTLCSIGEL